MDWKAVVDVGLGAVALVMARKLSVTVELLAGLVHGHDKTLDNHEVRLVRVEGSPVVSLDPPLKIN